MNYYLLFFAVYAAIISPVTLRFSLRLGRRAGFGLRMQFSGLPLMRKRKHYDREGERPIRERDVAVSIAHSDTALIKAIISPVLRRRLRHALELRNLTLYAHISFADASATALVYALAREALRALTLCMSPRCELHGRVETDFRGEGTEVLIRGIVSARLGSLGYTAILFGALYIGKRAALQQTKEDDYAAAAPH